MSIVLRIGAVRGNTVDHLASSQDATNSDSEVLDIPPSGDFCHRPVQTYPGCFGLPYQDHNYGAPPPLSPTPPKSPPVPPAKVNGVAELEEEAKVPVVSQEEEVVEDSITRCICGFLHDDGYMICCDKCSVWQHIDCMGVDRNNIPENYCCELCEPRKLDFERARMIQLRKKEEIDTSATDTDPEEPANALASLGKKQVQTKPKAAKQRRVSKVGAREKGLLKAAKLSRSGQYKRDKKLKLTKKEKENMKEASKKQKMLKSGMQRQKKLKKKLSSSLCQNKAEQWSNLYGLWNNYEEAKENEYSPEIKELLSRAKSNGIHSPHSIGVFPEELLVRLYQVSEVKKNRKGLEATDLIVPGRAVIEFKGKVMLRDHFQHNVVVNQARPYVLFYSKFEGLDLCIDASAYGGDARFIRRSCTPNSEMCHIIDNGNLHFIVQAKKEIAKGSEITIPFDFNYQDCATSVECACGRATCPVVKFWKKIKFAQKPAEKPKRKRQASGEGRVRRNSQSKGSPLKSTAGSKSPVKSSPVKSPGLVPLPLSLCDTTIPHEAAAAAAEGTQPFPVAKPATAARRSSRAASDTKEERDVKCSRTGGAAGKDHPAKAATVQSHTGSVDSHSSQAGDTAATHPASESEADSSSECPKKMTREERKMEAIMKAFEKMAKREERRKEALARLDKKHHDVKKEEPGDDIHPTPACTGTSSESGVECADEQHQPVAAAATPAAASAAAAATNQDLEGKVVIKIEDPAPSVDSPVKSQRRRPKRQRRRSRVQSMSAAEPLHTVTVPITVSSLAMAPDGAHMSGEDSREDMGGDHMLSLPTTPTPGFSDLTHVSPDSAASYMFHKTKKHLYNEWSVSRGPDGRNGNRMDPLEVQIGQEEFVPYTPSPRNAIEHWQRRNSTSSGCYSRSTDSSVGNAKKRWLRQAMHETGPSGVESGSSSPVHTGSCSPNHFSSLPSPGGSPPADFVTPLKKRRLARESLSQDQPPLSTPSTPSPSLMPAASPDFTTSVSPSNVTATVTSATLSAADTHVVESGMVGSVGYQADGAENGAGLSGCQESSVSKTEAVVPAGEADVSQSSSQQQQQEELSMDGLSSSASDRTVQLVCAGSSSNIQAASSADSGEVCDSRAGVSDSAEISRAESSIVTHNEASAMEVSLVDSSGAAFDGDMTTHREESGENVGSTDNEPSRPCVHSADAGVPNRTEAASDQDRVVECSSASADTPRVVQDDGQEGAVSEGSHRAEESMEVEESGNEASGSTCEGSQDSERQETRPVRQTPAECQVNSSQDVSWSGSRSARTASPSQGEAESNVSSDSAEGRQLGQGSITRDRERTGVSSAQDSSPVSSFTREPDTAASSDTECGPSSSTQVTARHQLAGNMRGEDMVCNSSDMSSSQSVMPVPEEGNVDSTSQSSRNILRRTAALHSSADNSHLGEDSEASSFCDSNSERGDYPATDEGQGVSSSGPADSQSTEVLDSGQVCVVSSVHSSVSPCAPSVSSSPFNSAQVTGSPVIGREVCSVSASSSPSVVTTENMDAPASSHPTSSASPSGSGTSLNAVDSASQDNLVPSVNSATSLSADRSEADVVGTSQNALSTGHGSPEANTSWGSLRLSERGDINMQPVSSMSLPTGEGEVVNGCSISSASSEDSYGAAPSTSVSSSEAQAAQPPAPVTKRKVSLFEYRKRLKGKTGSSGGPSSSPKSTTSDNGYTSRRSILDSNITLAPLPLFEPITINSERRESRDKEKEKREKPMSLSDRLRIEFGLEDSEEEERVNSAESLAQSSTDIPPPPPLPPNGMLGGVGVVGPRSFSASSGLRAKPTDDESESSQSSSGFATALPSGNTATSSVAAAGMANSVPLGLNHATATQSSLSHPGLQAGFAWPNKVQGPNQGMLGVGVAGQQSLAASPAAHPHALPGPGGQRLPNGSHSQPPAPSFSTGPAYQTQSHQPFRNGAKQQPPPPPPPPPSTAYPPYVAQSRTHPPPPHPQTSSQVASSSSHLTTRHGRSASFSHRSSLLGAPPAATSGRMRRASEDHTSPPRSAGRHHYEYSHSPASKQKGHFSNHSGSDRKRH